MVGNDEHVFLGAKPDVTNWKQFSKAFLNASPDGIVITDVSSKALISNTSAKKHFDIYPGTFIDTTLPELSDHSNTTLKTLEPVAGLKSEQTIRTF